jgi:hypothetical protein
MTVTACREVDHGRRHLGRGCVDAGVDHRGERLIRAARLSAEMQCAQRRGRIGTFSGMTLIVDRIDNNYRIHKRCQQFLRHSA